MPVIFKERKPRAGAGQLPNEGTTVAKTAVARGDADQHTNAIVKDSDADQRAISASKIKAALSRNANARAGQRELKNRRRELRLTPSADDLIRCAMEVSGLTAGDLAYEGARKLLENHDRHNRQVRRLQHRHRSTRFKSGRT
jgi:hypothetical protein